MADVQEQLAYLLSVDRLISAAEEVKHNRDRLLSAGRDTSSDTPANGKQKAKGQGGEQ